MKLRAELSAVGQRRESRSLGFRVEERPHAMTAARGMHPTDLTFSIKMRFRLHHPAATAGIGFSIRLHVGRKQKKRNES